MGKFDNSAIMKFVLVTLALVIGLAVAQDEEKTSLSISKGLNEFSNNLFKTIAENEDKNLVFSPLSAHVILSQAAYGATGKTAEQMRTALGLPDDDTLGAEDFKTLTNYFKNLKNVTLEVANSLYVSNDVPLKSEYKTFSTSYFKSDTSELDFENIEKSVNVINSWVNQKTHQTIPELVNDEFLDKDIKMVLLNAIYFKADWLEKFSKNSTSDEMFYVSGKTEKKVPTMHIKSLFGYGELPKEKAKFIALPYGSQHLKMVIVVPDEIDGLNDVIKNIELFNWKKIEKNEGILNVELSLPKFKIGSQIPLEEPLKKLGMTKMFEEFSAEFSKISDQPLYITKVLQKAMIEVNEEGSQAAASTAVAAGAYSAQPPPAVFQINRPFYYQIIDDFNDLTLFQGVIQDPSV